MITWDGQERSNCPLCSVITQWESSHQKYMEANSKLQKIEAKYAKTIKDLQDDLHTMACIRKEQILEERAMDL